MKISIQHFHGQYPSFTVKLHTRPDAEPFIEIKGCKIMSGSNGEFVSWPSKKLDTGKYWNHVYASKEFNEAVMKEVKASAPVEAKPKPSPAQGFDDEDLPF